MAVLPVGTCFVSSVNLTPEVGARLQKGDEFGFFLFGGSDIVMLFQNDRLTPMMILVATIGCARD